MNTHAKKTLSISEFEALVAGGSWKRYQDHEGIDRIALTRERWNGATEKLETVDVIHVWGVASKVSEFEGIKITYTEGFNYDEHCPDSFTSGTEGQDDIWLVEGVIVVDSKGEELTAHELADYLDHDFSAIDYSVLEEEFEVD